MGRKITGPWKTVTRRPSGEVTSERPFALKSKADKNKAKIERHLKEWNPNQLSISVERTE